MTPNQTIDGVPRSLLQSLYTDTVQQWGVGGNAAGQLRALLDKEVSGDSRAPQPQGEPVAEYDALFIAIGDAVTVKSMGHISISVKAFKERLLRCGFAITSVEQPAPVAVVLPERKQHVHQGLSHTDAKADGWNACLDEVARLTATVRIPEPLVMTDGLQTYEYVTGHNAAIDKMFK